MSNSYGPVKNILLIDDDQSCNFILRKFIMLENTEVDLVECFTVDSALKYLRSAAVFPDVIFLDLNMPVKNGYDFLDIYSEEFFNFFNTTQVIVLTASLKPEDKIKSTAYECVSSFRSKVDINKFIGQIVN